MSFLVFLFVLVVCLLLSLALLWRPGWLPLQPSHSAVASRRVQPLSVVDNSDISPTRLTFPLEAPYSSFSKGNGSFASFQAKRISMNLQVFLLVFLLLFSLALLCALCWSHQGPAQSRAAAKVRSRLHRLLKPRCPDDCPACRLTSTASLGGGPTPLPVRPWREVKSRRGAPKRIDTEGLACPNRTCLYFGITDAHIHALVGDGKHGKAEHIQTFRCQACRTTFTARRHTPLYRLKTPSHQVAMACLHCPKGWTLPRPNGSLATDNLPSPSGSLVQGNMHRRCTSARSEPSGSRICSWMNCAPGSAAPTRFSGSGWRSIPSPRFFRCLSSAPAPKPWPIGSSTRCDRPWLLAASPFSPVMA